MGEGQERQRKAERGNLERPYVQDQSRYFEREGENEGTIKGGIELWRWHNGEINKSNGRVKTSLNQAVRYSLLRTSAFFVRASLVARVNAQTSDRKTHV